MYSPNRLDDSEWHSVRAVWANPTLSLFIDGEWVSEKVNTRVGSLANQGEARIGHLCSEFDGEWHFHGHIKNVQITR